MPLYDRLLGRDDAGNRVGGKISIHQFQAVCAEWAKGRITGPQAQAIITAISGLALSTEEQAEALALVNTVPVGTTAQLKAERALRILEIDEVLLLADVAAPGYDTPTAVRAKLGV